MTRLIKRLPHLLAIALVIVSAASARAQVPSFLDTREAEAGDLNGLPLALTRAGVVEVDRAAGPRGPAFATLAPDRRPWSAPAESRKPEVFAGCRPLGNAPLAVCCTVSRPGLSARTYWWS